LDQGEEEAGKNFRIIYFCLLMGSSFEKTWQFVE